MQVQIYNLTINPNNRFFHNKIINNLNIHHKSNQSHLSQHNKKTISRNDSKKPSIEQEIWYKNTIPKIKQNPNNLNNWHFNMKMDLFIEVRVLNLQSERDLVCWLINMRMKYTVDIGLTINIMDRGSWSIFKLNKFKDHMIIETWAILRMDGLVIRVNMYD